MWRREKAATSTTMAPRDKSHASNKRKRTAGGKSEAADITKIYKKPKQLTSTNNNNKKPIPAKPFKKKPEIPAKDGPLSKKELRQIAKVLIFVGIVFH